MQLTLIRAAYARAHNVRGAELTRAVRPWALMAGLLAAYSLYTAFDSLPALLQHASRVAHAVSQPAAAPRPATDTAPATRLLMVTRCDGQDGTHYTDGACVPGAESRQFIVVGDEGAPSPHAATTEVCTDIHDTVHRISEKALHAPSEAERQWLQLRQREARVEQLRLGC